jgi:hypothetical protein
VIRRRFDTTFGIRKKRLGTSQACILRKTPAVSPGKFTRPPAVE